MEIRRATLEDLPKLLAVQREVQELDVAGDPTVFRRASDRLLLQEMQEYLANERGVIWIAWVDGVPAGYLAFKIATTAGTPFFHARHDGNIDDLAVAEQFRRQGIGRALVAEAERYAIGQGCGELRLFVMASNAAGRKFYDALDFSPDLERRRKRISTR